MLERERQEGKGGPAPARGFQEGKPDIGTCQRYLLPPPPPRLLPPLLAPEGCWQPDRQTDSAHIDWLTGTEPKCEPRIHKPGCQRSREGRGYGEGLRGARVFICVGGQGVLLASQNPGPEGGGGCSGWGASREGALLALIRLPRLQAFSLFIQLPQCL